MKQASKKQLMWLPGQLHNRMRASTAPEFEMRGVSGGMVADAAVCGPNGCMDRACGLCEVMR